MKTFTPLRYSVIFIALFFVACENSFVEEPSPINEFGVEFKNGALRFPTTEKYIDLLETGNDAIKSKLVSFLDGKEDYISLRKSHFGSKKSANARVLSTEETELVETNEFLSSLLNQDGVILIGDHYFKVNLSKEKVYVLNAQSETDLEDLKNENTRNSNIMVFSTDDDVLYLLEEGTKGTINGRTELFCGESGADSKKDDSFAVEPVYGDYRQDNKVVYQKAGIYFSLQAKTKMQYKSLTGLWVDAGVTYNQQLNYYVKYEPKCKGVTERTDNKTDDGPSNELNYRAYESTRGLHKYRYEADFFGQGYWSRIYSIADGF
jgi:hypothetical protein